MIDVHSHILPGLDDGSPDLQTSLAMASAAVENGIGTIVATPHFIPGVMENRRDKVLEAVRALQSHIDREKLPLSILPGTEAYCDIALPALVKSGEVLTVNDGGRYLLMELPMATVPQYTEHVIYELKLLGITPVIAHPERNKGIASDPSFLYKLVSNGVLAQVNATSLLGEYGESVKAAALQFLKLRWVHFLATDAHSPGRRLASLVKASDYIEKILQIETEWIRKNPQLLINNADINVGPLDMLQAKKGFLGKLRQIVVRKRKTY
ncbi:Protein-tyrosine-phosphatase [Desulfofarcimen acetoxidans DSM 771]|uniref:protein-tyrosine-phosphatase n=1 Tax=Desulfofarcimen acetoxidans (strain ATCC 49208 / DSM 771 / KCTC 5769 / VKM B-1644 / 5575) TaxID=485916 RepID=C8VYQ8_DESAS|nr:CpsB/CapC family capsule biosynthesis tyrosine phosphatase [Desulfofarcimen acetoxidans]ACV64779.1 Protein-tyrosine-phosphatase [Desulfofarcimen acetoxidans DSM 771]